MTSHKPQPWPAGAKRNPQAPTVKPWPSTRAAFIDSAMLGRMTPEDQAYMARALLQMSDEVAELRRVMKAKGLL